MTDEPAPTTEVVFRRHWNDWRTAVYPLSAVSGWHWSDTSGGVQARSPRPFVHAYVWCDEALSGEVAHSCMHGEGPHRIKVCLVQKDNTRPVITWAKAQADRKPTVPPSSGGAEPPASPLQDPPVT